MPSSRVKGLLQRPKYSFHICVYYALGLRSVIPRYWYDAIFAPQSLHGEFIREVADVW